MSRFVNVCALGPIPAPGAPETNQEAVETMIEWWRGYLDTVWPYAPDLVVLHEACDRFGEYSLARRWDYYAYRGEQVRDFLAEQAQEHRSCIAYSAARKDPSGLWYNTTELIDRNGKCAGMYHKNHVTRGEYEAGLQYGKEAPLIRCDFGTVACAICFDLNFEELRERYRAQRPDLIVFCSMYHGGLAQKIWAYECQAYFVGAVAGIRCDILSPQGEPIAASSCYQPFAAARINLDREVVHLDFNRDQLAAAKKKYGEKIGIQTPDHLGSVLLTSETEEFTVQDLIKEFGMTPWRDYYAASEKHREMHLK